MGTKEQATLRNVFKILFEQKFYMTFSVQPYGDVLKRIEIQHHRLEPQQLLSALERYSKLKSLQLKERRVMGLPTQWMHNYVVCVVKVAVIVSVQAMAYLAHNTSVLCSVQQTLTQSI